MTGRLHITFMCFPAKIPKVMQYIGLIAKNNSRIIAMLHHFWQK